jgi:Fic family protein
MTKQRKYEETHPWLKFQIDITGRGQMLWMLMGEAKSKCEHIAKAILEPDTSEQLHKIYLAKGALATTAIEGNTLSEEEVMKQVEKTLEVPPSKQYLAQETQNIIDACNSIIEEINKSNSPVLSPVLIKDFNQRILKGLKLDEDVVPGEIRKHSVAVGRYRAAPAEDCEHLLDRLCDWLNGSQFSPPGNLPQMITIYAFVKAILAHLYIAWIHPFGDGNGRTARLIELLILATSGIPIPACQLLSNHYNQTRTEYYRQLDQASGSLGDCLPFLTYAVQGFVDGLAGQLNYIHIQQWKLMWKNYVHDQLKGHSPELTERCALLVMALSDQAGLVAVPKLPELSPRLAGLYAKKTTKTLSRDVGLLMQKNLIEMKQAGVRAKKEIVLAFRPLIAKKRDNVVCPSG